MVKYKCIVYGDKKPVGWVDHQILLDTLYNCGLRGNVHCWFRSYLSNRTQCVEINKIVIEKSSLKSGVTVIPGSSFIPYIY